MSYSIRTLTETFIDAIVGTGLRCGKYVYDVVMTIYNEGEIDFPLPRMPDECVDAMFGDNPFGNALKVYSELPEKDSQCFTLLANDRPECTLDLWPIPIVGTYLKAIACLYGNALPILEESCNRELTVLSGCLSEGEYSTDSQCTEAIQDCAAAESGSLILGSLMSTPAPLLGRPMSDTCRHVAQADPLLTSALTKYEVFRGRCVSEEDKAVWEIEPRNTLGGTNKAVENVPLPSGLLFVGLVVGVAISVAGMIIYRRRIRQRRARALAEAFERVVRSENSLGLS